MITETASPSSLLRTNALLRKGERRRHQRVRVSLTGRYMLEDRREFACRTIDMSPGGVALAAPLPGEIGSRVIAYIDQIGRIEGVVARWFDGGFALAMNVPVLKREKLADKLTWLANRHALGMLEDRRHERIIPRQTRTTVKTADGREYLAKLMDVSISGAAVQCDAKIETGAMVTIGNTRGHVVRVFAAGFAVEFSRFLEEATFDENVRL